MKDDIQSLKAQFDKFDKANAELRAEVEKVDKKFDAVNQKFDTVSSELSEVKTLLKTLIETNKKA